MINNLKRLVWRGFSSSAINHFNRSNDIGKYLVGCRKDTRNQQCDCMYCILGRTVACNGRRQWFDRIANTVCKGVPSGGVN